MLRVESLSKRFSDGHSRSCCHPAVDDVTFNVERGEIVGIVGESGCGKSTLGRMLVKLLEPSEGRIWMDDIEITGMKERVFRRHRGRIQIVFQHPEGALDPCYTLRWSLEEAMGRSGIPRGEWDAYIASMSEDISLPLEILDRRPDQVSGGEIQRVALARTLAFSPDYLILDEPTSMLDVSVQAQIMDFLERRVREASIGTVLISHDLDLVRRFCDRTIVMRRGSIVEDGVTSALFDSPNDPYTRSLVGTMGP